MGYARLSFVVIDARGRVIKNQRIVTASSFAEWAVRNDTILG
jgi:hypothetical protein